MNRSKLLILPLVLLMSCAKEAVFINKDFQKENQQEVAEGKILQQVYLIGDVGESPEDSKPALDLLKREFDASDQSITSVVFLGDNIYPEGLHPKDHPLRKQDEERIDAQINSVQAFQGEVVFIPGNHDWQRGGEEGYEFIRRQEKYVQEKYGDKIFRPNRGCSGPKELELSDELTLIIIDTQWWLHKHKKGRGEQDNCPYSSEEDFIAAFKEALKKNRNKHVIVTAHHPLYSNGRHGGYFTLKDHIFPLSNLKKGWVFPIPLIGSIYPFYRSFFGNIQDITNPTYQGLKKQLILAMSQYDNVIYAAGHEHNLQYFYRDRSHYIVSGAGSKTSSLRFNNKLDFGAIKKGLAKVEVYENGSVLLKYFDAEDGKILFQRKLYQKNIKGFEHAEDMQRKSYKGMYQTVVPDSVFYAKGVKKLLFGDLNRAVWTIPIKVPYLDIHYEYGGLQPVGKGGGMQTISLKLIGGDGRKYKLRGIKKSAEYLVDRELRETVAQDVVYDGIAGSHPYASVVVPKMAEAASIYYTEPRLVYIPKDSILGDYLNEFGGMFALLEVHPDDNMETYNNFGNSKEIVNYSDAIEEMQQHHHHVVDLSHSIRSRLFDIFLGDWDRHDDQWRWATFEEEDKVLYRPIPRDRDQVFFQFDGVVMSIANRKWLLRKFQPFREEIRDIAGLSFNARYFDRSFLVEGDREDWIKEAKFLQESLTDEAITAGIRDLPKGAYAYNGEELIETLKVRRQKLVDFANRYYDILAKEVDVAGTIKKDYFEVNRLENGDVEVSVYPRKKGKKVKDERFYHRIFKYKETSEIRLYGLGDKDEFKIKGEAKKSILVRIIAGDDKDKIVDNSTVRGWTKKTKVYEVEGSSDHTTSSETSIEVRENGNEYYYNRKEFAYDQLLPLPSIGFNPDDGFFVGPGISFIKQGFKKHPYKYKHSIYANYAFRAEGVKLHYENDYKELLGNYDIGMEVQMSDPQVYQFYGLGNQTNPDRLEIGNSDTRVQNYDFKGRISRTSQDKASRISFTTEYQFIELKEAASFISQELIGQTEEFVSFGLHYEYNHVDEMINPTKGLRFMTDFSNTSSINSTDVEFFRLKSELSFYLPFNQFRKQTTLALRAGYAGNFGDYNFYQANFLSGLNELRGVTRNRFAGKSAFYYNTEIRKSLKKVQSYVIPFDVGVLVHGDLGRVWVDDDQSDRWHNSFGAGMFFNILDMFALVGTYSISDVDRLFNFGTRFYF